MKMAKASEADLNMAMDLSNALENLAGRWSAVMPEAVERLRDGDESEYFDIDNPEQCQRALRHILGLVGNSSLMRVVFGCAVMLDPANGLVDPNAHTIEHHPDNVAAKQDTAALNWIERQHLEELGMGLVIDAPNDGMYYVCGDSGTTHYGKTLREALDKARAEVA